MRVCKTFVSDEVDLVALENLSRTLRSGQTQAIVHHECE